MTGGDAVGALARHLLAMAVHDQIDLFRVGMMMREVCARGIDLHQE